MGRFLAGVALGAVGAYWYLTGEIPLRDEIGDWFSSTASGYTAESRRGEADSLIRDSEPAQRAR